MFKQKLIGLATTTCVICSQLALAQTLPSGGLYQIVSGTYLECCGIAGTDTVYSLPNSDQAFISLRTDSQTGIASMVFLGQDRLTVFSRVPCTSSGAIQFSFPFGFASSYGFIFHVDPGPPPYGTYWSYTASNSPAVLKVDGTLGIVSAGCADTPTHFTHSNVLAVLIPPPRLSFYGLSTNRAITLLIQGHAGKTNVTEASIDLKTWIPVSTNVMDYSLCPICPYAIFEDPQSTNLSQRFYRVGEL